MFRLTTGKQKARIIEALGFDGIIIMHEWYNSKNMDVKILKQKMRCPIVVDTRNILEQNILRQEGFLYETMGNGLFYG